MPTYEGLSGRVDFVQQSVGAVPGLKVDFDREPGGERRLTGIANTWGTGNTAVSGFGYGYLRNGANDPTGQIRQWTQNHSGLAGPRTLALGYDEVDQLKDATRTETGGAVSGKWSYGYDKSGNRLAALENGVVSQFVANDFNQLTGTVAAQKFPVKFAGTTNEPSDVTVGGLNAGTNTQNWSVEVPLGAGANSVEIRATETTSIAPGTVAQTTVRRAQLTLSASPARVFGYDLNGSTTADGLRTYEWDAANRLRAIVTAGSTVKRTEFTYDGGNRWVKLVEKETNVVVGSREVIWEGASIAQLRLKNAIGIETERRTFYGGGEVRTVGATTTALLETSDHLGNVRELLDTTGNVRARYDYDVYGKRTKVNGDLESDLGFTGHYEHAPSALTLAPFRAYDAVTGRWISRDPIEESGGLNLYGYVGGNVAGAVDPLGWLLELVFDKDTLKLTVTDLDTKKSMTVDAFSGGTCMSGNIAKFETNGLRPDMIGGPIPNGKYSLVSLPPEKARKDWYGLFTQDNSFNDATGWWWDQRSGFRLHPGSVSDGCVTVPKTEDGANWKALDEMIKGTKAVQGPRNGKGFSTTIFGTMTVK